jgi:carbon storage regulator CsrA
MLVISRKQGEKLVIGNGITVTIFQINGNRVSIGIEAPPEVPILRGELAEWLDLSPVPPEAVDKEDADISTANRSIE